MPIVCLRNTIQAASACAALQQNAHPGRQMLMHLRVSSSKPTPQVWQHASHAPQQVPNLLNRPPQSAKLTGLRDMIHHSTGTENISSSTRGQTCCVTHPRSKFRPAGSRASDALSCKAVLLQPCQISPPTLATQFGFQDQSTVAT